VGAGIKGEPIHPLLKPVPNVQLPSAAAGALWGFLGTAFSLAAGAPWPVAVLIGVAVGTVFASLSRIGFKRAERDWANRMGGDGG